jgi:hypothetical protein
VCVQVRHWPACLLNLVVSSIADELPGSGEPITAKVVVELERQRGMQARNAQQAVLSQRVKEM